MFYNNKNDNYVCVYVFVFNIARLSNHAILAKKTNTILEGIV